MTSRRAFIERTTLAAVAMATPAPGLAGLTRTDAGATQTARGFLNLVRPPDRVDVQTAAGDRSLRQDIGERWVGDDVIVTTAERGGALHVGLSAPVVAVRRVHLRWRGRMTDARFILSDAWERGYGDLEWRQWVPDRAMPWYCATHDGMLTHAYGVRTNARALCFWQLDPHGVSLWADVRSGGVGVQLRDRALDVCDVVCRAGRQGESAFAALHAFCRQMCTHADGAGPP